MELDNEGTLVSLVTGLEALLIVSSRGGGRVVGLWRKLSASHGTAGSGCLSETFRKLKGE
jgi:hypothetical protein